MVKNTPFLIINRRLILVKKLYEVTRVTKRTCDFRICTIFLTNYTTSPFAEILGNDDISFFPFRANCFVQIEILHNTYRGEIFELFMGLESNYLPPLPQPGAAEGGGGRLKSLIREALEQKLQLLFKTILHHDASNVRPY